MAMKIRPKRERIDPDDVVRAGVALLDSEGLDRVTLTRLASKFGVQPPALYWHFKDKQDLTNDMAEAILRAGRIDEIKLPKDKAGWAEWLTSVAHSTRRALISHRDGGRLVAGAEIFRVKTLAKLGILVTVGLRRAGFDLTHAYLGTTVVFDYIWRHVVEEQSGQGIEVEPEGLLRREHLASQFGLDFLGVEEIDALFEDGRKVSANEKFDWGLRVIIDGLKSALKDKRVR